MNYSYESQLDTNAVDLLCQAIANVPTKEDVKALLRDLLTLEELEEASRRFAVAKLLSEGKSYRVVAAEAGVSTTTVTRIASWLHHGTGGYRRALQALDSDM